MTGKVDKRKLRLITPCSVDADIACIIKGAHLTEDQALDFLRGNKYYCGQNILSVILDSDCHGYIKKTELNGEDSRDYECEGKYAWCPCGSNDVGAVPCTIVEFIEYGESE